MIDNIILRIRIYTSQKISERAIIDFIKTIKDSFNGAERVYTHGSCYQFFKILQSRFPSAEAYYNSDHVITKIDNKFYDINGEADPKGFLPIEKDFPDSLIKNCYYDIEIMDNIIKD